LRRQVGRPSSSSTTPQTSSSHPPTELNGLRIQRLKSKLGTKGVPTAELELTGLRAYLIGDEGQGVKEISSILNVTRLHTASAAAGYLSRGLAVSRAYTKVRKVRGGLLADNPQHLAWMATETVKYRANTHLVFLGVALLGASEQTEGAGTTTSAPLIPPTKSGVEILLRILTPVMKAQVSLNSVSGLRACMESLGGVGYCENNEDGGVLNVARLFRDSVVGTIWEGTTSVMAEDVLRVVKRPKSEGVLDRVFGEWMRGLLEMVKSQFPLECQTVQNRYACLLRMVEGSSASDPAPLLRRGREVLEHLEAVACACLLMYDACADGDEVAAEVARRWARMTALPDDIKKFDDADADDWTRQVEMDRKIFLGSAASASTVTTQAKL